LGQGGALPLEFFVFVSSFLFLVGLVAAGKLPIPFLGRGSLEGPVFTTGFEFWFEDEG